METKREYGHPNQILKGHRYHPERRGAVMLLPTMEGIVASFSLGPGVGQQKVWSRNSLLVSVDRQHWRFLTTGPDGD